MVLLESPFAGSFLHSRPSNILARPLLDFGAVGAPVVVVPVQEYKAFWTGKASHLL